MRVGRTVLNGMKGQSLANKKDRNQTNGTRWNEKFSLIDRDRNHFGVELKWDSIAWRQIDVGRESKGRTMESYRSERNECESNALEDFSKESK